MAERDKTSFRSLAPLPGGPDHYLATLLDMLTWLAHTEQPTRATFSLWLKGRLDEVTTASANNYLQALGHLNVVDRKHHDRLVLTPFGKELLTATDDGRRQLLADYLLQHFVGLTEVLAFYAQVQEAAHLDQVVDALRHTYASWTGATPCVERTRWLLALRCLRQVRGRVYEITELGRASLPALAPDPEAERGDTSTPDPALATDRFSRDEWPALGREVEAAATDSGNHKRMERAAGQVFRFVGYEVRAIGGKGDTDLLLQTRSGAGSYSIICDTKSRQTGRFEDLDVYTLEEHRGKHQADYIVVLAASFAGGKTSRQAIERGIVLLTVPVLVKWLALHAETPLSPDDYRAFFMVPGLVDAIPTAVQATASHRQRHARLLKDIVSGLHSAYDQGLNLRLSGQHLFNMLATRERSMGYTPEEIRWGIALLTNPALGCAVGSYDDGVSLLMTLPAVGAAVASLARLLQTDL